MSVESVGGVADKREVEQFMAGWAGLLVCGLVAAIIWFFGIRSVMTDDSFQTSALECAPSYGVSQPVDCVSLDLQRNIID